MTRDRRLRVLAVSSGGGHWVQLCRCLAAFEGCEVTCVTVRRAYASDVTFPLHVVRDATRWSPFGVGLLGLQMLWILLRERPGIVFTTGAAPGLVALVLGRLVGARTIWLDSVANAEEVSMSGRLARRWADLWLTQWPALAGPDGPEYAGAVF
ncbi:MAG: UDP-N-acetylglucosamine transferase subunit ALG14 [Myxococcota bacterium]|nr:UDP-N-acetylglucosamine transferase subunit ALG14 [Myxococcota bacterium]